MEKFQWPLEPGLIAENVESSALRIAVIDEQRHFGEIQRGRFNRRIPVQTYTIEGNSNRRSYTDLKKLNVNCEEAPQISCKTLLFTCDLSQMFLVCNYLDDPASIQGAELIKLIRHCGKLQRLWIMDCIGDKGLVVVATICKELQELRVFPSAPFGNQAAITEVGLVAMSKGCPKLHSLLYFCHQMTNAALITVAKNCPNFIRFRLCILDATKPDSDSN
ncbi:hypothetical protein KIW84_076186 [Lathyrus oleraceus]|uniref:Uncharacterized protein n=1 Tax=Pisum sativum TaxID=3888 RepID=A0A9D4VVU2_PEA|nr:hypothetical protein KIW84_076186 [Pisum sativum]